MLKLPSLTEMLEAGMHLGHKTSRWHPKMDPFIFGVRSGVHIINLEKTTGLLQDALNTITEITSRGGVVLFVGTKIQAKDIVKKYAEESGMPYVTERWLGGTLTNFKQIKDSIKRLKSLKDKRDKGELKKYTKKEQLLMSREIDELEIKVGGIQDMTRVPEAMFVIDVKNEKTAILEAKVTGTQVVAVCDTNINPIKIDKVIPANDDAVKSIEILSKLVCDAIKVGKANAAKIVTEKKEKIVVNTVKTK